MLRMTYLNLFDRLLKIKTTELHKKNTTEILY